MTSHLSSADISLTPIAWGDETRDRNAKYCTNDDDDVANFIEIFSWWRGADACDGNSVPTPAPGGGRFAEWRFTDNMTEELRWPVPGHLRYFCMVLE